MALSILGVLAITLPASADWGFSKSITIDRTKVGATGTSQTTLADFPILIHITDNDLRTTGNGGDVTDATGDDIAFGSRDADTCGGSGACALYFEIESYSATTGELVAWVRIPELNTLAATSDTVIYIYYGNSSVTSPLESPEDVWDSDFKGVWHLHDDFLDSTSNSNDGTNNGSTNATGSIADGQDFDGTNDYVQTTSNELATADDFTISAWFNSDDMTYLRHLIWEGDVVGNGMGAPTADEQEMSITMGGYNAGQVNDIVAVFLGDTDTTADSDVLYAQATLSDTTNFHHVVAVFENLATSPAVEIFLDGVTAATDTGTTTRTSRANWDTNLRFGRPGAATRYFNGIADEVRVSTVARDADWIATEFNTVDDPGDIGSPGFYTVGSEQAGAPTAVRGLAATAELLANGVDLRWSTESEIDNLGFYLYRERSGRSARVTSNLIPGSALRVRSQVTVSAGDRYSWIDSAGTRGDRYWIESVDLSGTTEMHGPFPAAASLYPRTMYPRAMNPRVRVRSTPGAPSAPSISFAARLRRPLAGGGTTAATLVLPPNWETPGLTPAEVQSEIAAAPAIKIAVRDSGWTRITAGELLAAGLEPAIDPRRLQLYCDGVQHAIVVTGAADGSLDLGDAVEFWGAGKQTPWSDVRTYWLVEGQSFGRRIATLPPPPTMASSTSTRTWATVEHSPREIYFPTLINGEKGNFFGSVISPQPSEQILETPFDASTTLENLRLEVALQGVTEVPHSVRVEWNGIDLGSVEFDGRERGIGEFEFSAVALAASGNSLTLTAENGGGDFSFVEHVRVSYWRSTVAVQGELLWTTENGGRVEVSGFGSSAISVADVTDPGAVQILEPVVMAALPTAFSAAVEPLGNPGRTLFAFEASRVRSPLELAPNLPSQWHDSNLPVDVIAISHGALWSSAERWRSFRELEGWKIALIDVEDLYDEFNFGEKSPWAIRRFLESVYATAPRTASHVILFGDASYDPRGYISNGTSDLLPTWLAATEQLETASDDWFVDFDLDGMPEWAIGRISARSDAEAHAIIDKIIDFTPSSSPSTYLIADVNDNAFDFEQALFDLAAQVSAGTSVEMLFRSQSSDPTGELLQGLGRSPSLVSYVGHGSRLSWGGGFLTDADVSSLRPGSTPAVMIAMTCLSGYFHDPFDESLSEVLIQLPDQGAVGVWSSSGMCRIGEQSAAHLAIYEALFSPDVITIGAAVRLAKSRIDDPDVRRTWNLLGDPLLRLR